MSIEFLGSGDVPRMERNDNTEQSRAPVQGSEQPNMQELNQSTSDKVREVIQSQQADNERRREMSSEEIQEIADSVATMAQTLNRELQFSINTDIDETVITVLDRNTGETVRQIPSEEIVRLAERMQEYSRDQLDSATGFLLDSQA